MTIEVKDVNPKEKMWLVRASTNILGPYCLDELVHLLVQSDITFADEIRRPKSRWNFIREYPYLVEIVKSKKEAIGSDQGKTITFLSQTTTDISSKTPVHINFDDMKDIEPLKEVPFTFNPTAKKVEPIKSYGSLEDQNVKIQLNTSKNEAKSKFFIVLAVIVIVLIGVKGFQKIQEGRKIKERIGQISRLYNLKLYEEANSIYEELKDENEITAEILELLSPTRIVFGKESSIVRAQIQKNFEKATTSKKRGDYLNLIGLSYLFEGDSAKAYEFFQNSSIQDPNNEWAIINMGIIKYKKTKNLFMNNDLKKEVLSFYKNFSEVRSENYENINYYLFLKGLFNLEFKDILKEESSLNIKEVSNAKNKTMFLRNELQVIYIGLKKNEGSLLDEDYMAMIESLPRIGKKFTRSPLLDWSLLDWGFIDELCEKISSGSQFLPLLFKAYCSLEAGQYEKADELMNKALLLARGSNHYELMQLHIAFAKSETIKIDSLLKKTDLSNFAATYYYKGVHCLNNKNFTCAKDAFTMLQTKFSDWSYLAQYGLYLADNKTSKPNIYEGSRKEPFFKPLLSERAAIERVE